jgi:type IV pilus assembly protein PilY1
MNAKYLMAWLILVSALIAGNSQAQTVYSEDFTGATTNNQWYFFNGACLTAGSSSSTTSPGQVPSCASIKSSYYNENLVGGNSGTLPDSPATASTPGGALRFTNGNPGGYSQNGAIVSKDAFPTGQGLQVTFKTITYRGDSGGAGGDGADGISFYLMDGSKPAGIGAWGGSLAYSCSNANPPYDGLAGAYIGLGIDEYGNFLNGSSLMPGYAGTNNATGDNAALGYGYKPGRIGIRGAGSVSWTALTTAYGTNPSNPAKPYYPASLATTCNNGTYDSGKCQICSSGTYSSSSGSCIGICASGTYNSSSNSCVGATPQCSGSDVFDSTSSINKCESCSSYGSSYNYVIGTGKCKNGSGTTKSASSYAGTPVTPTTASPSGTGQLYSQLAVQKTCSTGNLYNYLTASNPTNAGAANLANNANTKGILDYAPIPNAYQELSGVKIANESAVKRSDGTPIFYNLKITQDGLLSLSYSISGGAYQPVIKNQSITASNGALPDNLRFGFAGSTGGSTNIHEIMCFKAASADTSGSSATVNEKQAAKVEAGTQAYFAFYNPNNWTGKITANNLLDTAGKVSVQSTANWDASCVLTGTSAGAPATTSGGCDSTGVSGPTSALAPSSRVMLTWSGSAGIPFEWANLTSSQKSMLTAGDATTTANRLNYLRGDRSNEINSAGVGLYRARQGILGDIVDSSPVWVGPPNAPYTSSWQDRLNASASLPENSGQSYVTFVSNAQTRLNVIYTGANDGFLHGFRAGSFDTNGKFVDNTTTPNDGSEVLAYMPGAVLQSAASSSTSLNCTNATTTQTVAQNIHGVTPAIGSSALCINPSLDLTNTQYGHNFFVDASPGSGDLYYGAKWHTWLVGGLGAGGAAIYALDITDPSSSNFAETNAATLVVGEWNSATISCSNASGCGSNLGNTYGTPQIRRLHNGQWAVIFGNGYGSSSGDAGIYVGLVDKSTGQLTFYYLSTGKTGGNGIAYVTPADLDGDHITDYLYAGDLKGNVWRFDLTSSDPSKWASSSNPLFTTPSGQPITSQLLAVAAFVPGGQIVLIEFGTGQRTQITNVNPVAYASGTQTLYGIWDWNMKGWNGLSTAVQYQSLVAASTGLTSPYTLSQSNLQAQTFTDAGNGVREGTNNAVCWQGTSGCTSGKFGWYANLPGSSEQIIYNPVFFQGAFIVNSTVPANNIATSCTTNLDSGFTYIVSVLNGGVFKNTFPKVNDTIVAGIETDATGSANVVNTIENQTNIVYQTVNNDHGAEKFNVPTNTKAKRLTWIQLR